MKKKLFSVVFGLTADPIHKGHEQVIINSVEFFKSNGLSMHSFLLMPVYNPNLIAGKRAPQASFEQRLQMCELVAKRLSKRLLVDISVSDMEKQLSLRTGKKNYSVDTLQALNLTNGLFIASADHFNGRWPKFRKWHRWQDLVTATGLLIHKRPGNSINRSFIEQLKSLNPNVFVVESMQSVDTSSTFIRKNFSATKALSEHLSSDIIEYIQDQKLYLAS